MRVGVAPGYRDMGYSFTLHTPDRGYCLSAVTEEDRDSWIVVINKVLQRPLTPQDSSSKFINIKKTICLEYINYCIFVFQSLLALLGKELLPIQ